MLIQIAKFSALKVQKIFKVFRKFSSNRLIVSWKNSISKKSNLFFFDLMICSINIEKLSQTCLILLSKATSYIFNNHNLTIKVSLTVLVQVILRKAVSLIDVKVLIIILSNSQLQTKISEKLKEIYLISSKRLKVTITIPSRTKNFIKIC